MNRGKNENRRRERGQTRTAIKFLQLLNVTRLFRNENMIQALPFIFFLTFIGLIYISNTYYAEKTIREIDRITRELKELRSEYISTKSELMFRSKQSEVAKAIRAWNIKESLVPPVKIRGDKTK